MRYTRNIVAACCLCCLTEAAHAQSSNPFALDRLFLMSTDQTPFGEVLSFNSPTAVANYYGESSFEETLAQEFFAGYTGDQANMLVTRYPVLPARAHLYGGNLAGLTLAHLKAIKGTLSIMSEGYHYSARHLDLSGVTSFSDAANVIQKALNANLPVVGSMTGSIAPVSVSFNAWISGAVLHVKSVAPDETIEIGGNVFGPGLRPIQNPITAQLSGKPGGPGTYALYRRGGYFPTQTLTETYGVLTVGSVTSGTVAVGEQLTGAGARAHSSIQGNLSGAGAGSTWVVDYRQTVSGSITMTGAPISVIWTPLGPQNSAFVIQQNGDFNFASSKVSYARGTAAGALGLTPETGAFDSTPGEIVTDPTAWMDNLVEKYPDFDSFQVYYKPRPAEWKRERTGLEAWAEANPRHDYLEGYSANTPPIVDFIGENRPFAARTIPESSTWAMMLLGFAGLGFATSRRLSRPPAARGFQA